MENHEIDVLIDALRLGERSAFDRLIPLICSELIQIARSRLRQLPQGSNPSKTELVDDAYVQMSKHIHWELRSDEEFTAAAAIAMKRAVTHLNRMPPAGRSACRFAEI